MKKNSELRLESLWTTVGGLTMYARVKLDRAPPGRPPVILVHGFVISSRYMIPLARELAPHYPVYAPDLPGSGNSERPGEVLDVTGQGDALAAWMEAVGLERAILLGNSFGCQVVATCAARHEGTARQVVLSEPTVDPRARSILGQGLRLLQDLPRERPSLLLQLIPPLLKVGPRRFMCTAHYVVKDRIELSLPHIQVPALVVRGARDPVVSEAWTETVARLLPKGRLIVIPNAPHALNYSTPKRFARVVRAFVSGLAPFSEQRDESARDSTDA